MTAEFTVVPKLGFRVFALYHHSTGSINQKQHEEIKPFLSHLGSVNLDKLMPLDTSNDVRQDFEDEMLPSLFPTIYSLKWLPGALLDTVREYLHPKLNSLKALMLDIKPLTARQVFKLFTRVETFLKTHYS